MKKENFKGYELQRLIGKLRIRGLNIEADKLEKDQAPNYLSHEATMIIEREKRY